MSELVGAAIGSVATAASSVGWFVPMLVAAIAYFQYEEFMDPEARVIDVPTDAMLDKYDFIIIGAGSAGTLRRIGCPLAKVMNTVTTNSCWVSSVSCFQGQYWRIG